MKSLKLDKEEEKIIRQIENDEYVRVKDFDKEKDKLINATKEFLKKKKNINLRISESDMLILKRKSTQSGIPYQTLLAALIHKYTTGQIKIEI